jgi:aspartate racemase
MVHADTRTLLANQAAGDVEAQVSIYGRLAHRLRDAGCRSIAVSSIAGHFCIGEFSEVSVLPVIDLLTVVGQRVHERGYRRVGLLGTRGVMESRLYGALGALEVVAPAGTGVDEVHDAYVAMASTAHCTEDQRRTFFRAGSAMVRDQAAEVVLLAGTDLALAFTGHAPGFATFDCAAAHVAAIAAAARDA